MKRNLLAILLSACFLLMTACGAGGGNAQKDTPEDRISAFLTTFFTCPDEKLTALYPSLTDMQDSEKNAAALEEYREYLHTVYSADDFTEKFYQSLPETMFSNNVFPMRCAAGEGKIKVDSVSVKLQEKSSDVYDYTAQLTVTQDGTEQAVTQVGKVQTDENGKISWIDPDLSAVDNAFQADPFA